LAKILNGGEIAICLLNRDSKNKKYMIDWNIMKIKNFERIYKVKDLWKNEVIGNTSEKFELDIPSHDVVVYRLMK